MPHKRLNHSAKVTARKKMGFDLPPGKDDKIPRSMALVLGIDDGRTKRKRDEGGEDTGEKEGKRRRASGDEEAKSKGKKVGADRADSKPGPLNREDKVNVKPLARKSKSRPKAKDSDPRAPSRSAPKGKTEFAEREERRRVNDVAVAPPTLKRAKNVKGDGTLDRLPVSESVRKMMEAERSRAIEVYRAMKRGREESRVVRMPT